VQAIAPKNPAAPPPITTIFKGNNFKNFLISCINRVTIYLLFIPGIFINLKPPPSF
jgi:hypothetical protein